MRRKYHKLLTPKKIAKNRIKTSAMASRNSLNIWSYQSLSILAIVLLYMITTFAECQHNGLPSISQISPKSSSNPQVDLDSYLSTSHIKLESTILESKADVAVEAPLIHEENETRRHIRVERSAQPILNENFPKSSLNDVQFPNESEKEAAAGRYLHYNIKPTGTYDTLSEYPERTKRVRTGKTLSSSAIVETSTSSSFLLKGDLRQSKSGSPIKPTSSTAIVMETTATAAPHNGRQNPNPDIQDIITGIVKLLNGNVNVHANTQGQRRPAASRINNRGPPRISDVPALPMDYDTQKPVLGTSIRPPPYPFDRPERPFITGVPIPEQIVPFRPGFVSNRPPWHRNKPRPPITTSIGGRRPIQQYKPLPPTPISSQQEKDSEVLQAGQQVPLLPTGQSGHLDDKENPDSAKPTDTTNDSEFSSEDANAHYIEVSDPEPEHGPPETFGLDLEDELLPPPAPAKKDKKPSKNKNVEKKKHSPEEYTTIIETSSVVNTIVHMPSSYLPMPMASEEGAYASTEEVIFMTPSKTSSSESFTSTVEPSQSSNELLLSETLSSSMSTSPLPSFESRGNNDLSDEPKQETTTIPLTSNAPPPSTTIATATTTTTTTSTTIITEPVSNKNVIPTQAPPSSSSSPISTPPAPGSSTEISQYQPRPGIVLDDPEFKPGGRLRPTHPQLSRPPIPQQTPPQVQPTRHHLPPGYGEIFDVTLSAIQGLGSGGGSQQTINIKPYGSYGTGNMGKPPQGDIIISASGEERFVSIDGKRTYINLFGDPTDPPTVSHQATTPATRILQIGGSGSSGGDEGNIGQAIPVSPDIAANLNPVQGVSESEVLSLKPTTTQPKPHNPPTHAAPSRPHYRPRTTQPPVRIDTCIVGDDSTCDQAQHERCKTDNGVSSCHCRPGYSRRKHREPCRKVISFYLGMRVDRIYEHRIIWDNKLLDYNSEPYGQLSYESVRAIDSAMSMTPYSDEFMEAKVNNIYRGDPNLGGSGVFVNMTIKLDESVETLRPNLRTDIHKHLLGVLQRRNNNIGNSVLYVASPEGAVSALHDLDECQSRELNDCHSSAICTNTWGSFRCTCETGFRDPWADQPQRAGRECQSCPDSHCSNRGTCSYNNDGNQVCTCNSSHYGGQCEIDGEVLGVAIGASVAAVIIIVLTLVCLIMWSRRWQREQKNAMGSPVFGYMNTAPLKSAGLPQPGYQVTLEDRMRWAQIADVMAQTNHYGAEPIAPTRPSSALFAYPNLQAMGMGTIGAMSLHSSMQMSQSANMAPPVPLPRYDRLGLSTRSNGMRTLENSSSSEEEDRTDLLGRNFQVPRPKSRSNGSITNQSGIYYDVDYEPSGNGIGNSSIDHLYGSQNQSSSHSQTHSGNNHIPGPQGIPMSTYTSGRAPSSYYMK